MPNPNIQKQNAFNNNNFNSKYAVTFDYEAFQKQAASLNSTEKWNNFYKTTVSNLYRQMVMESPRTDITLSEMLEDFEADFITPLREELQKEGLPTPTPYGNLSESAWLDTAEDIVKRLPKTEADLVKAQYLSGAINLRYMRLSMKSLDLDLNIQSYDAFKKGNGELLASYISAIEQVNESRSFLWKVFHPIRNHAEKRDAALMKEALKKAFPDDYKTMIAHAAGDTRPQIATHIYHINTARESIAKENERKNSKALEEAQRIEKEQARKETYQRVTAIGYRPSISNPSALRNEYAMLDEIKKSFAVNKLSDPAMKEITEANKKRCATVYNHLMHNNDKAKGIYDNLNEQGGRWETADKELQAKFSDYKPEPFDNLNREPIIVSEAIMKNDEIKVSDPVEQIDVPQKENVLE